MTEIITPANLQDLQKLIAFNTDRINALLYLFRNSYHFTIVGGPPGPLIPTSEYVIHFAGDCADTAVLKACIQSMADTYIAENLRLGELVSSFQANPDS